MSWDNFNWTTEVETEKLTPENYKELISDHKEMARVMVTKLGWNPSDIDTKKYNKNRYIQNTSDVWKQIRERLQ